MKRYITSGYVFNPAASPPTVDLSAVSGVTEAGLLAIIDTTTDLKLYAVGTPGFGIRSYANGVVGLQASAAGCAANDALLIILDDGASPALDASLQSILAKLGSGVTIANQISGFALDSSLQSILTALKAQVNLADALFTDGTNFYVRRETVNEGTGAFTVAFENVDGSAASPTIANLKPVSGTSRVVETAFFDVTTAGSATAAGDVVARGLVYDTVAGTIAATLYQNLTQGTTITAATAGTLVEQTKNVTIAASALPANAAQEAGGNLAALATAFGTGTTAAPAGDTAVSPFMGLFRRSLGYLATLAGTVASGALGIAIKAGLASATATGTVSAAASNVTLAVDSFAAASIQLLGTWAGTLTFYGSPDGGTTYYPISAIPYGGGASTGVATGNGLWELAIGGLTHVQVVAAAALSSGTATVNLRATAGLKSVRVGTATGNPLLTTGTAVAVADRSGTTSSTANTATTPFPANAARQFARITNLTSGSSTGTIYVFDKASGTPATGNSIPLSPGQSYVWDAKVPSNAIQVFSPTGSVAFEAAEG